jgi:hypothetical protein
MTIDPFVVRIERPRGGRWRSLLDEWYVDEVGESLSLPPTLIVVWLKPEVGEEQARDIADRFRSLLDGGSVRIERLQRDQSEPT